jgi:hypothetical protein
MSNRSARFSLWHFDRTREHFLYTMAGIWMLVWEVFNRPDRFWVPLVLVAVTFPVDYIWWRRRERKIGR